MSAPATVSPEISPARHVRVPERIAAVLLAGLAVLHAVLARQSFSPVEAVVSRYHFDQRRPDEVVALRREPAGALAAAMLAEMALEDSTSPVSLASMDPKRQRAWIESVVDRAQALRDAQGLLISALRSRPGWAYLRYLIGRTELAAEATQTGAGTLDRIWPTLRSAAQALPGLDAPWVALAAVALDRWPQLPEAERGLAREAVRRGFADEEFVRASLPAAMRALGREEALRLLPEEPGPLQAALERFAAEKDAASYAALEPRWRDSSRRARARQLSGIEARARTGELLALADDCRVWAQAHRSWSLDDAEALSQALRVLELWPRLAGGSWDSDIRGELVRFFLNGREESARGPALSNAIEPLTGVPEPVRAQVALLAGEDYTLETLIRSPGAAGSFDWIPVFAAQARRELAAGRLAGAREAVSKIPEAARDSCEVLLVRKALARASGDRVESDRVELRLAAEGIDAYEPDAWSPSRTLSICVDPEAATGHTLRVGLATAAPAYVEWGWNGSRSGSGLVPPGSGTLDLPLEGRRGRVSLLVFDRVGGPTRIEKTIVTKPR